LQTLTTTKRMISAFVFTTSMLSIMFHIFMGIMYFSQFTLNGNAQYPATILDPCGFLSLGYFFSNSAPSLSSYLAPFTLTFTLLYLRTIGLCMLSLGLFLYYETLFMLQFKSVTRYGLLHFVYMLICVGGFRNHWTDVDNLWPWFIFHFFLCLSLLKLKRAKVSSSTRSGPLHLEDNSSWTGDDDDNNTTDQHDDSSSSTKLSQSSQSYEPSSRSE